MPALGLALQALRTRSWRLLWGLEVRVLAAGTLAYLAFIWWGAHGWLDTLPLTVDLYHGYNAPASVVLASFQPSLLLLLASTGVIALPPLAKHRHAHVTVLGLAWVWAAIACLQHKGWHYHLLPACMLAALSLGVAAAQLWSRPRRLQAALSLALALALGQRGLEASFSPDYLRATHLSSEFSQAVMRHAQGRPWVAWSTTVTPAFPLASMIDGEWASRMVCQWLLPGATTLVEDQRGTPAQAAHYRRLSAQINAEDLVRHQPAVVMVHTGHQPFMRRPLDLLAYFGIHPDFEQAWAHYRYEEQVGVWAVYVRKEPASER
jgi:hypothetical protein